MTTGEAPAAPPFCPNPACPFHQGTDASWRWMRAGFFARLAPPHRVQRFQCCHCRRHFSEQTFRTTYWLKRPELLPQVFHDLVKCSGYRQIAREHRASPQTIQRHASRLGRHCQLFHESLRPPGPAREPLALDGFQSFEYSQYYPTWYHVVAGQQSHFFYGFTDSELRRSGSMSAGQKRRRAQLESLHGRPDPRSIRREVAAVLRLVAPHPQHLTLHTDEHVDYPRAIADLTHLEVTHHTISSRAARTARNPLFAINLLDLLIRHSGANHKRETLAFSKRRQSAAERLWVFLVWRNYLKWFSERKRDGTPAMKLGVCRHRWRVKRVLAQRLFPSRIRLPRRWQQYYWGLTPTRAMPGARRHTLTYAA